MIKVLWFFVTLNLVQHNIDSVTLLKNKLLKLDEVLECFHVSGDYDYILKYMSKTWKLIENLW